MRLQFNGQVLVAEVRGKDGRSWGSLRLDDGSSTAWANCSEGYAIQMQKQLHSPVSIPVNVSVNRNGYLSLRVVEGQRNE